MTKVTKVNHRVKASHVDMSLFLVQRGEATWWWIQWWPLLANPPGSTCFSAFVENFEFDNTSKQDYGVEDEISDSLA